MRIVAAMKVMESGCVLPTSTCPIQVHSAQMVGERSSHHQFTHVEGKTVQTSTQLTTPPMEFLIPGYVEELWRINLELQMDLAG